MKKWWAIIGVGLAWGCGRTYPSDLLVDDASGGVSSGGIAGTGGVSAGRGGSLSKGGAHAGGIPNDPGRVCVYDGITYALGQQVPTSSCRSCICSVMGIACDDSGCTGNGGSNSGGGGAPNGGAGGKAAGGFAGTPAGGSSGGTGPSCGELAGSNACRACSCKQCPQAAADCFNDPRCAAIRECAERTGCLGSDCDLDETCGKVKLGAGAPQSISARRARELEECMLSDGCIEDCRPAKTDVCSAAPTEYSCFSCGCELCKADTLACMSDPECRKLYECANRQDCLGEECFKSSLCGAPTNQKTQDLFLGLAECLRWGQPGCTMECKTCSERCGLKHSQCQLLTQSNVACPADLPVGWLCPEGEPPPIPSLKFGGCGVTATPNSTMLWCCTR
ncbi:MAG: hypothetical protein ACOY0T_13625 [Myxococcota bacterium]